MLFKHLANSTEKSFKKNLFLASHQKIFKSIHTIDFKNPKSSLKAIQEAIEYNNKRRDQKKHKPHVLNRLEQRNSELLNLNNFFTSDEIGQRYTFLGLVGWGEGCLNLGLQSKQNISAVDGFLYSDDKGNIHYQRIGSCLEYFLEHHQSTPAQHNNNSIVLSENGIDINYENGVVTKTNETSDILTTFKDSADLHSRIIAKVSKQKDIYKESMEKERTDLNRIHLRRVRRRNQEMTPLLKEPDVCQVCWGEGCIVCSVEPNVIPRSDKQKTTRKGLTHKGGQPNTTYVLDEKKLASPDELTTIAKKDVPSQYKVTERICGKATCKHVFLESIIPTTSARERVINNHDKEEDLSQLNEQGCCGKAFDPDEAATGAAKASDSLEKNNTTPSGHHEHSTNPTKFLNYSSNPVIGAIGIFGGILAGTAAYRMILNATRTIPTLREIKKSTTNALKKEISCKEKLNLLAYKTTIKDSINDQKFNIASGVFTGLSGGLLLLGSHLSLPALTAYCGVETIRNGKKLLRTMYQYCFKLPQVKNSESSAGIDRIKKTNQYKLKVLSATCSGFGLLGAGSGITFLSLIAVPLGIGIPGLLLGGALMLVGGYLALRFNNAPAAKNHYSGPLALKEDLNSQECMQELGKHAETKEVLKEHKRKWQNKSFVKKWRTKVYRGGIHLLSTLPGQDTRANNYLHSDRLRRFKANQNMKSNEDADTNRCTILQQLLQLNNIKQNATQETTLQEQYLKCEKLGLSIEIINTVVQQQKETVTNQTSNNLTTDEETKRDSEEDPLLNNKQSKKERRWKLKSLINAFCPPKNDHHHTSVTVKAIEKTGIFEVNNDDIVLKNETELDDSQKTALKNAMDWVLCYEFLEKTKYNVNGLEKLYWALRKHE